MGGLESSDHIGNSNSIRSSPGWVADSPVYKAEPEGKKGKARILHHTLLLPRSDLPIVDDQENETYYCKWQKIHSTQICSVCEEEEDYSFEPDQLEFLQPSTIHGLLHRVFLQTRKSCSSLVIQSYPSLCRPMRTTVLLPQTYLTLYQRVLHKSMRPLLHHDHKETEDHHQGLCTIKQENHSAAVICLPISHHQQ